jgi:hypothetical protein
MRTDLAKSKKTKRRKIKMKYNGQKVTHFLLVIGLLTFGAVIAAQAQPRVFPPARVALSNIVFRERSFQVRLSPTDFTDNMPPAVVRGTGQIRLSGTLTTATGACARVKITISRKALAAGSAITVFKEQTFEICGSLQVNITDNLNASEDDAIFLARAENIDPWNKTNVSGGLIFRYPTADRILTGQPSIKFDLPQGIEANRQFTLIPNTPGKLKVKVVYGGNTTVRVTLKKPNGQNARPPVQGASGLEFTYDIQEADITGGNVWTVNVLNLSNTQAEDVDVSVIYTVEQ